MTKTKILSITMTWFCGKNLSLSKDGLSLAMNTITTPEMPNMVVQAYNLSSWEAEVGQPVHSHLGLPSSKTLSLKTSKQNISSIWLTFQDGLEQILCLLFYSWRNGDTHKETALLPARFRAETPNFSSHDTVLFSSHNTVLWVFQSQLYIACWPGSEFFH